MVTEKICRRCAVAKPAADFRADDRYSDNLASWCKACHRERNSSWAKENRAARNAKAAKWRSANLDSSREANRRHKRANIVELARKHSEWVAVNRDKRRATNAKRKAAKLAATPRWANAAAIAAIYKTAVDIERRTGVRMHVDHIIPLQHPLVCGLHCEANLQILRGSENESKRNRLPDIEAEVNAPRLDLGEPAPRPEQVDLLAGAA